MSESEMGLGPRSRKIALDSFASQVRQDKAPARKKSGKKGVKCGRGWISPDKDCEPQKGRSLKQKPGSRRRPEKGGFDPSTGYAIAAGLLGISALSGGAAAILEAGIGKLSRVAREQVSRAEEEVRSGQKVIVVLDGETGERIFETESGISPEDGEKLRGPRRNIAIVTKGSFSPSQDGSPDSPFSAFGPLMAEATTAAREGDWENSFVSAISENYTYRISMEGKEVAKVFQDERRVDRIHEEAFKAAQRWAEKNGFASDPQAEANPEAQRQMEDRLLAELGNRFPGFRYESFRHGPPRQDSLFFDSYPRWDTVDRTLKGGVGNAY